MSTTKKLVIAVVALSVAMCCMIGGTLAWLLAESNEVTNTFTVGNIEITLWENNLQTDGTLGNEEVVKNDTYKVVPGATQPKNPTVTVKANSENCYVYMKVTNNMVLKIDGQTVEVATYTVNTGWELIGEATDANTGVKTYLYRFNAIQKLNAEDQDVTALFNNITYADEEILLGNINELNGKTIVIQAYAHQSDNVGQTVADEAAIDWAKVSAIPAN